MRLLCLLSSVELRNSSEFRLKPKQSEAFSAASLPAGPQEPCFTRCIIEPLGHIVFLVAAQTDRLSLSYSSAFVFFFSAGVVGVLFPVVCPLPLLPTTPQPRLLAVY